jgi:NitT/TauT family transport system permease protein
MAAHTGEQPSRWLMLIGLVVFLGTWEISSRTGLISPILVPPPSSVIGAFQKEMASDMWTRNVLSSLGHYSVGVVVGSTLGIALGIAAALSPVLEATQEGVARLLRPIPPIAWIPFAIIWFGVTETAAAFIIAIGVFWLNYFATHTAVKSVDKGLLELAAAFGQNGLLNRLGKVILPGAASGIFSGLRSGLGMGWIAVLAAELFGISGIGQRMMEASGTLATDIVVLYMATIAALYAISDSALVWVSKKVLRWTH